MHPESGFRIVPNWPETKKITVTWQFDDMKSSSFFFFLWRYSVSFVNFSYWSKFYVNVIDGSGAMAISFTRDLPEIRKSETPPSEFCPISGDLREWGIPNLTHMSLMNMFGRILKMPRVLNVPEFWIWHSCICKGYKEFWIYQSLAQYATIISEYASISLNVPQYAAWTRLNIVESHWNAWKYLNRLFWLCQGSQYAKSS